MTAGLVVGLLLAALAPPAFGLDPIRGTPLPDEGRVSVVTERATESMPFDLDGDGVRELLVITAAAGQPGLAAVQAFWFEADGRPRPSNRVDLLRSAPGTVRGDAEAMTEVRITEPARLLSAARRGSTVALVAVTELNPDVPAPCCVTIWEVRLDGPGAIDLALVADTHQPGSELASADLDANGTDELIVLETSSPDEPIVRLGVLRWDGTRFVRTTAAFPGTIGCCSGILDVGDSDGQPGDDVLMGESRPEGGPGLIRMTLRNGEAVFESAIVQNEFMGDVSVVRVLPLSSGPALGLSDGFNGLHLWAWGRDAGAEPLGGEFGFGVPLAVLGNGVATRVLIGTWPEPQSVTMMPIDPEIDAEPVIFGIDVRAAVLNTVAASVGGALPPGVFAGPIPGGLPGRNQGEDVEAFAFGGQVIVETADPNRVPERSFIATLPGLSLAGTVGPGREWMAIRPGSPPVASGNPFGPVERPPNPRVAGLTTTGAPGPISVVPTAVVLAPELDDGVLSPTLHGVAPEPGRSGTFIVGSEAVDAEITGPPGTVIRWAARLQSVSTPANQEPNEAVIGQSGVVRLRLLEPLGPDVPDGAPALVGIWLITPAGHAYRATWPMRADREPPAIQMDVTVPLFDFAPTVTGRTLPGSTVTANGVPGEVDADGSFVVPVDASIFPTDVRVVVSDPVGNRTERVVTRVWPFDYRQLPWTPIVVALTAASAVFVFIRGGTGTGPRRRTEPDEESPFEEIGG